jgi:hypothetical protein
MRWEQTDLSNRCFSLLGFTDSRILGRCGLPAKLPKSLLWLQRIISARIRIHVDKNDVPWYTYTSYLP